MSYLIASIPPVEVFIKKEFLYDFQLDQGGKQLLECDSRYPEWHIQASPGVRNSR